MEKRVARFAINQGVLADLLRLPDGTKIEDVVRAVSVNWYTQEFVIVVSHPDFAEVREGDIIPVIDMFIRSNPDGTKDMLW